MILVFGKSGQVGNELAREAGVLALDRSQADLTDPGKCAQVIRAVSPDVVINAAAYTAVDAAENDELVAEMVNRDAPCAMAHACKDLNIPFLHISTDYVFPGNGQTPWSEDDIPNPQNSYGRSKLAGEEAILAVGGNVVILRTSWVFSAHENNFAKTMLRLAESHEKLDIVDDQVGGPTPAKKIAEALLAMAQAMLRGQKGGIYHFSGKPNVSWADFAREIFKRAEKSVLVTGISSSDYPTLALRPLNSRLSYQKIQQDFKIVPPDWRIGLDEILQQ